MAITGPASRPMAVTPARCTPWPTAPDGATLATGGDYGTVRIWHIRTGRQPELTGHTGPVYWGCWGQVAGQPVLATGGDDGTVRLWNPAAGMPLGPPLAGHQPDTARWGCWVAGHPVLATGGDDDTVRLWNAAGVPPRRRR